MKKILSVFLVLLMALMFSAFALAANPVVLTYDLSCADSTRDGGVNKVVVETGDIITVSYKLSASAANTSVSVTQNEIYYDHNFFELVAGSNKTSAGFGDYVTSLQTRLSGKRYVYFNTIVTHHHGTAPQEIGTFQLKVIAASGQSTVASVNNKAGDITAQSFGSAKVDLHVSIDNPQPQTFTVTYEAAGGTVTPETETVDAGQSVTLPTPTRQYYTFSHWSLSGDSTKYTGTYTPTSNVTFTAVWTPVPAPAAPTGLVGVAASGSTASDGKITGTTSYMEYSARSTFEPAFGCAEGQTTGLAAGTYYVRFKAVGNTPPSTYAIVVISASSSGGIGGGGGGGGGVSTGNITIAPTQNGRAEATPEDAAPGDLVTITATPDPGYKCSGVTATGDKGNTLAVTDAGDGTYTFIMPEGKVLVTVTFAKSTDISEGYKECKNDSNCPVAKYTDLDRNAWYHDGVHFCLENGLMNGVSETQFDPNGVSTRAMIVTILYRLDGLPAVTGSNPYTDVAGGTWYTDAIIWADANNIVNGYGNNTFGPNDSITREQMAAILYRYAGYKAYDVSGRADLSSYADGAGTSSWAQTGMSWANANGLITGLPGDILAPQGDAIRVQVAAILQRFYENLMK